EKGRLFWQKAMKYGKRALVETMMACWKALIGFRLCARRFAAQKTEAAIGVAVLNRLLSVARPHSVRRQVRSA
ncbi:IS5/IS1182 family transposase, partial [Enterobacter bugandensis]